MKYLEMFYPYWDAMTWGIGRFFLWVFIICAIGLFLCWLIESVLQPAFSGIKSVWWDWTRRCPECESARPNNKEK